MKHYSETIGKTIGNAILQERRKLKMTQAELGAKIHVSGKQVSNYEKGEPMPPLDTLLELCNVFNCELGYLLGEPSYAQGSALETEIHKITGLSKESMTAIQSITGVNKYGFYSDEHRKILNAVFPSALFSELIDAIQQLDKVYDKYPSVWKRLENEIGNERYQKAWEHYQDERYQIPSYEYDNGEWDYKCDPQAPDLSEEEIHDMVSIDVAIDEEYRLERERKSDVEIARYYANKTFGKLIDELYPEDDS